MEQAVEDGEKNEQYRMIKTPLKQTDLFNVLTEVAMVLMDAMRAAKDAGGCSLKAIKAFYMGSKQRAWCGHDDYGERQYSGSHGR
jgi:hypothetical protein